MPTSRTLVILANLGLRIEYQTCDNTRDHGLTGKFVAPYSDIGNRGE